MPFWLSFLGKNLAAVLLTLILSVGTGLVLLLTQVVRESIHFYLLVFGFGSLGLLIHFMRGLIEQRKRAEDAWHRSQATIRQLTFVLNQNTAHVLIADAKGSIVYVNAQFEEKSGYTLQELKGQPLQLVTASFIPKKIYAKLWSAVQKGQNWQGELFHRDKSGQPVHEHLSAFFLHDQEHDSSQVVLIFKNLNAHKQMEKTLQENKALQQLFKERLPVPLIVVDPETCIIEMVNTAAVKFFGSSQKEIIGRRSQQFLYPPLEKTCTALELGQTVDHSEQVLIQADGSYRHVLKATSCVAFNGQTKLLECMMDISPHKQIADELKQTNKRLEEATTKAKQLAQEAAQANAAKGNFLATMSHEIRTPMNAIIGLTQLVLEMELSVHQRDYLVKVERAARSLLGVLNDILDFSKIESGHLHLEKTEFNLTDILDNLITVTSLRLDPNHVELVVDLAPNVPTSLVGDPMRLEQILVNLASNAAKFTSQGQINIQIRLERSLPDNAIQLLFTVQDTGIGMNPKQLSHVLQPFVQADSTVSRHYGGTGLGLSIAHELIKSMHGRLNVWSEPGQGSNFSFTAALGLGQPHPQPQLPPELAGATALIIDDLESSRNVLVSLLSQLGINPTAVSNAQSALTAIKQSQFSFIFLDWHIPDPEKLTTWQYIISHLDKTHRPHTILMTPLGREDLWQAVKKLGVDAIMFKPTLRSGVVQALLEASTQTQVVQQPPKTDQVAPFAGGNVLLVEDNEFNQEVAVAILKKLGLEVVAASNGPQAIALAQKQKFDLVLMDIQMPGMNGFEVTRQLRAIKSLNSLPIVAMTAHILSTIKDQAQAVGMNDLIVKPIDIHNLYQVLRQWFKPIPKLDPEILVASRSSDLPLFTTIDWNDALGRFMGDRELLIKTLLRIRDRYQDTDQKLHRLLKTDKNAQAQILLHTLRGVVGNISATALNEAIMTIEDALAKNPEEYPEQALLDFQSALQGFVSETTRLEGLV